MGSISNPIGIALGFVLPTIFVQEGSSKSDMGLLLLVQAIMICSVALCVLVFFEEKPSVAPSQTALMRRQSFSGSFKTCLKNKSFMMLWVAFAFGEGALNSSTTLIEQMSKPYGFSTAESSLFGVLIIISGITGSSLFGSVVGCTQRYRLFIMILLVGSATSIVLFVLTLPVESLGVSSIFCVMIGFLLNPILPLSFELGCELAFPVAEATAVGLMNSGGQLMGIIEILLSYVMSNNPEVISYICAAGIFAGVIAMVFCKQELKRSQQDKSVLETPLK